MRNQKQKSTLQCFPTFDHDCKLRNECRNRTKYMPFCFARSAVPTHTMFAYSVGFPRRHIQDPASQRLTWSKPPLNVLVIRKIRDETLLEPFKELCRFLVEVGYTEAALVVDLQARKLQALLLPFHFLRCIIIFFYLVTQILIQLFPQSGETSDGLCGEESCG